MVIQISGVLDIFVLKKASQKEITGKMIINKIDELTEGNWKPSPGTVYPLLSKLTKKGLLKKYKNGKEIYYKITPKGKKELKHETQSMTNDFVMMLCNMSPIFAYLYGLKIPKGMVKTKKKWFIYLMKNPEKGQYILNFVNGKLFSLVNKEIK